MYQNKGFTLIELLVVVLIIGILAAVAVPKYSLTVRKTKAAAALDFLEKLSDAQSLYFIANGAYPSSISDLDVTPPTVKGFEFGLSDGGFTVYANPLPRGRGLPGLNAFGAHSVPYYGHLVNQRYCISVDGSEDVCRALGGKQDATYGYRFYLPRKQ